jgi:hypothetical protein
MLNYEESVMNKHKLTWAIATVALVFLVAFSTAYAGDPARIGTAAGEQLLIPVGARDLAMNGANAAFTKGLDAIYWNPAGFASFDNKAAGTFSTMQIFSDINVNYLALGLKMGKFGQIGFSLKSLDLGEIPITTNEDIDGTSGATYSPSFLVGGLTYSQRLTDAIFVGATAKLVSESIPRASATGVAFDIGIQYHNIGNINGVAMGLVVKNIGTNMQYTGSAFLEQSGAGASGYGNRPTASNQLPTTVELGLGYQYNFNEQNSLIFDGNFENNNFGNDAYKLGLEYAYTDLIFLRGGYKFMNNTDSEDILNKWTLGAGIHYRWFTFDYTYRDSEWFDGNNMFQLTFGF